MKELHSLDEEVETELATLGSCESEGKLLNLELQLPHWRREMT